MSEIKLTDEQLTNVRKFIHKYGEDQVIDILNHDLVKLSVALFNYKNRKVNEQLDRERRIKEGQQVWTGTYTVCGFEQELGHVIAWCEYLKIAMGDRFNDSQKNTTDAVKRFLIDHAEHKAKEKDKP